MTPRLSHQHPKGLELVFAHQPRIIGRVGSEYSDKATLRTLSGRAIIGDREFAARSQAIPATARLSFAGAATRNNPSRDFVSPGEVAHSRGQPVARKHTARERTAVRHAPIMTTSYI